MIAHMVYSDGPVKPESLAHQPSQWRASVQGYGSHFASCDAATYGRNGVEEAEKIIGYLHGMPFNVFDQLAVRGKA